MKAFTRLTDENGNETEIELEDLAIFANVEEIQELIDFLKYVKEDHIIQHKENHIPVTHSHFSMWKGGNNSKPDLQIWSVFEDENK